MSQIRRPPVLYLSAPVSLGLVAIEGKRSHPAFARRPTSPNVLLVLMPSSHCSSSRHFRTARCLRLPADVARRTTRCLRSPADVAKRTARCLRSPADVAERTARRGFVLPLLAFAHRSSPCRPKVDEPRLSMKAKMSYKYSV
jgi:hypothetical protein